MGFGFYDADRTEHLDRVLRGELPAKAALQ